MSKNALRESALRARRSIPGVEVGLLSRQIQGRLLRLPEYASARTLSTYVAKSDEVQTAGIIESAMAAGKRVLVPRAEPSSVSLIFAEIHSLSELGMGHFGILEPPATARPVSLDESDMVLIPVVAWDMGGHRIGYGKGYFDKALGSSTKPLRVGLAFESQRCEEIPHSASDVDLDILISEQHIFRFGGRPS